MTIVRILSIILLFGCISHRVMAADVKIEQSNDESFWISLRLERDKIIKDSEKEKASQIEIVTKLVPLWEQATEHVYKKSYEIARKDKNHFAHTKALEEYIQSIVANMIASNSVYKAISVSDMGVLNLSLPNIPDSVVRIGFLSPIAIGPDPNEKLPSEDVLPEDISFLRKRFSKAKHILFFEPFLIPSLASLESAIGHELGHLTQPYMKGVGQGGDDATNRLAEIDADLKNICIQKPDGTWTLKKNHAEVIENFIAYIKATEVRIQEVFAQFSKDLSDEAINNYVKPLRYLHFLRHPKAADREFIMKEFILTMKDFGDVMTDEEFNAAVGIIAALDCQENNIELTDTFLKLIRFEQIKKIPKVAQLIKIPELKKEKAKK